MKKLNLLIVISLILLFIILLIFINLKRNREFFYKKNVAKMPIYISLTSIFKNQKYIVDCLQSILNQTKKPDKIFLYLSEEPYLLDDGFKNKKITNKKLVNFINNNYIIEIKWTKNSGPYRKLLPLLKEKWKEDCIIITIDDDTIYDNKLIENLLKDYIKYKCVIGYRGFTPLFDKFDNFDYSKRTKEKNETLLYNFLTGKGGILYKPQFFHKTDDLIFNDEIYLNICKTNDDIWFYIIRILNNKNCYIGNKEWLIKDITGGEGLFSNFNGKNKNNNKLIKNTVKKLKELGYKF